MVLSEETFQRINHLQHLKNSAFYYRLGEIRGLQDNMWPEVGSGAAVIVRRATGNVLKYRQPPHPFPTSPINLCALYSIPALSHFSFHPNLGWKDL